MEVGRNIIDSMSEVDFSFKSKPAVLVSLKSSVAFCSYYTFLTCVLGYYRVGKLLELSLSCVTILVKSKTELQLEENYFYGTLWTAINRLSVIWKSDLTDKIKHSFFQAAVVSILLYGCITWTLTKWMEKKLDGNYARMLRAILNKSWRQHSTMQQLYGHLTPITKTIQVRRTRHAGHCWRSRDELISDVLLWTPSHGWAKAGRPARTYIQQLY